jgi:hypothetical protein
MEIATICQELGYTYDEYINSPKWFIKLMSIKLQLDNKKTKSKLPK